MDKIQTRIKALLAKAIGTTFPEERDAMAEGALKLAIENYRVTEFQKQLRSAGISKERLEKAIDVEMASASTRVNAEEKKAREEEAARPFKHDPNMIWNTADGRTYRICDMETTHLINIRRYLERKERTHIYAYRNIVAEIKSREPEFPWKPIINKRKSK